MAHNRRKAKRGKKWPNGFPDGPTRTNRRQHTKSLVSQRKKVAQAKARKLARKKQKAA